jgi:ubiquinol-cytochrome c reductase cytochrome b subunit
LRRLIGFIDSRLQLTGVRRALLNQPIPGGASWVYVFGGVTLFFFLLQLVTGIALAVFYVPSPDHAYESVQYINQQVYLGWFLRRLHHWGASGLIVAVGLHMLQVFLYGAYKPPREFLWVAGVALFVLVLMFAFTGYLLPWDQKAYWATRVGTGKVGTVPFIGDTLLFLIRGGEEMGASTLTRFFAMHTLIFPWVAAFLTGLHLFILKQIGPAGPWDEARAQEHREAFYPRQVVMDVAAIGFALLVVVVMAVWLPFPLADEADPTAYDFVAVPDWYFLFYYQLLSYMKGPILEPVGTILVPVILYAFLFALPFIDRRRDRRPSSRPVVLTTGVGFLVIVFLLLGISVRQVSSIPRTDPHVVAGKKLFDKFACSSCHRIGGEGGTFCPNLSFVGRRRDHDWLVRHFKDPQAVVPGSPMPAFPMNDEERENLTAYMLTLK